MAGTFTLNLTIAGVGQVDISGVAIYGSTPAGFPITYSLTLPTLTNIYLTRMYVLNCESHDWSGDGVEVDTTIKTLVINSPDILGSIYNVTITFYCTPIPVLGDATCCGGMVTAAPPEPTSESVRIANLQRCVAQQALPPGFVNCAPCRPETTNPHHLLTTTGERDRLLRGVTLCPQYHRKTHPGGFCPHVPGDEYVVVRNQSTAEGAPILETTRPSAVHQYRTHSRIRGIEEITRPVRGLSAGELTTNRRAAIAAAAASAVRHGEHFRTLPPPPPCRRPNTLPQPGVPYRPYLTPCIPGEQRVDYSNPIAK